MYSSRQTKQFNKYEMTCKRCGACCGADDGDPCEHLKSFRSINNDLKYYCSIYSRRSGIHKTINGTVISCVPIRAKRFETWPGRENCGYKNVANEVYPR